MELKELHSQDFNLWLEKIAASIKNRDFEHIDWDGLLEEIEDMGASEKRALRSYTRRLIDHILKLKYWRATPRPKGYRSAYRRKTQTPVPSSRRQSLQRGEPPQRAALGTRPTDWLGNARDDSEKDYNQKHWEKEVVNFRYEIAQILKESPSLKNYMQQNYQDWYFNSVKAMQREFTIPDDNFVSLDTIMNEDYFG